MVHRLAALTAPTSISMTFVAPSLVRSRWAALLVLILGGSTGVAAQAAATDPAATAAVTLRPGDAVRITVWRKSELSGEFVIAADGTIAHPLYRDVAVGGVALNVVEARLRSFLEKLEANPQFVVEPLLRVAVGGEVRLPNLYNLRPETSISQAVALAGGPTERGRRDRVRLVRDNHDISVALRRGDSQWARTSIRSGDQIFVERDRAVFRDYISPTVSILGAAAAIVSVILYNRN